MLNRDRHDPPDLPGRQPETSLGALEEVGDFHRASDSYGTALEYYEGALRGLGAELEATVAARLTRKIAECYRSKGLLEDAAAELARAREFLQGAEFDLENGIVLRCRAEVLIAQGQAEAALRDAELAMDILKTSAAHAEFARAQTIAAECHGRLGHAVEYEQLNLDALATYRRIDDQVGIANVYNNLGVAYKNACQWDKAIRALTQAKALCEKLGLTRKLARTLNNLGIVYTKTREFDEAISHLRRARRLVQQLGDTATLVSVLNSMGRALVLAGRSAQAEKYLLQARVLAEKHHLARSQALADEFLGDMMLEQGRLDEARENYESGLRKARALAPKGDVVGELLRRLADLELRAGLRSQAVTTARRALKICQGCGEEHEIGFIHRIMGRAYSALGRWRRAVESLQASIEAFEATRNPYELAWSRTQLAEAFLTQCGREALLRAAREAQVAVETFRRLEDDRGYCHAGIVLAQAHKGLGNHDDGLLVLYDLERICEECPDGGYLPQVRTLRKDFEGALVAGSSGAANQLNLFGELYALANPERGFDAQLQTMLRSLCNRTECSGAFLALLLPGHKDPLLKGAFGMDKSEALGLARTFVGAGLAPYVSAHVQDALAEKHPEVARRAGAVCCQPLCFEERRLGLLYLERPRSQGPAAFSQDEVDFIATYANLAGVVLLELFREDFRDPEPQVVASSALHPALRRVITADPAMDQVLALAAKVARSNCTVLITGETGTGKGLLAHCLHLMSDRAARKFIALNCAALPEQLLESELFGHVRGAFTGAEATKMGLLEAAHTGTVFLDEVGKTSLFMQGKLLQFLDSSEVRPVGSNEYRKVDVRVICASKSDLRREVEEGRLLEDLYYRLNDFPIAIPPLRERRSDIKLLIDHYLRKYAQELNKRIPAVSRQAIQLMQQHAWPGNVRELEKCVKRAVILADDGNPITVQHLAEEIVQRPAPQGTVLREGMSLRAHLARVEAELIGATMRKAAGNKSEAARILGISYPNLLQKIKLYDCGVERPSS